MESDSDVLTGGGPLRLQWTGRWAADRWFAPSTDVMTSLPNGDASLHPLSAKAASVEARFRLRLIPGVWAGWFARRVSLPEERIDPQSVFPSGSGFDLALRRQFGRAGVAVDLRHTTAGLPKAGLGLFRLSWRVAEKLDLEAGAMAAVGPADARLIESGWQLGLRYVRPRSAPAPRNQPDALSEAGRVR